EHQADEDPDERAQDAARLDIALPDIGPDVAMPALDRAGEDEQQGYHLVDDVEDADEQPIHRRVSRCKRPPWRRETHGSRAAVATGRDGRRPSGEPVV